MTRRFTRILAALALLTFLAVPLGMRGQNTTVTKTMNQIVADNNYTVSSGTTIGDIVTEITLDNNLTMSTSGDPNCGTFWGTTTIDWRLYQNQGGDVTITASNATLVSVKFTYNKSNNGTLKNGTTTVNSGTTVNATGQSITLTVGNTGNATNGQVRITAVEVVYTPAGGGTPDPVITTDAANNILTVPNQTLGSWDEGGYATLKVSGTDLTAGITLTLGNNSPFEMSTDLDNWLSSVTIPQTGGSVTNEEVAIRLKESLATAQAYSDNVTLSSTGAADVTVALTGSVVNPTYTIEQYSTPTTAHGTITFAYDGPLYANTTVTLNAEPVAGYEFTANSWVFYNADNLEQVTLTVTDGNKINMPNYNLAVDATFTAMQTYTITAVATPAEGGTVVTDDVAWEGKVVEIAVEANAGYALSSLTATYVDGSNETQELTITNNTFVMPAFAVTVTATFEESNDVTYDFTQIDGFADWGTSYTEHVVEYPTATVTFASANHQTGTITNQPVTKGEPVTIVMAEGLTLTSAAFVCTQWSDKAQTITLLYSIDGGETFTSTGVTSSNFRISANLPVGTNAVKITFSSQSNQVGIASATVSIQGSPVQPHTLTLGNHQHINDYYVFINNENGDAVEFDANGEMEVYEGATVYVSVAEVEDCYLFNGLSVTYGDNQHADTTKYDDMYYSFVMPAGDATLNFVTSQATQYTLTVAGSHFSIEDLLVGVESDIVNLDANNQADICERSNVLVDGLTIATGYVLTSVTLTYGGETVEVTPVLGLYEFQMPSSNATLTFTTALAPTYTLANSIETGKSYIIVGFDGDDAYAMGEQKSSNRAGVAVTVNGTTAFGNENIHEVVITALEGDDAGKYTIEDNGYLYASSSSANQLKTEANLDANGNGKWTIVIDSDGAATITAQGNNSHNLMRFNPNNGSPLFACYSGTTGSLPRLYVKDEAPATETFTLDIDQYNSGQSDGWYLIASPVSVDLATNDMVSGTYDLYRFNPTAELEWENYKATENNEPLHTDFTTLEVGRGYLYANGNDGGIQLSFTGVPSNNGQVNMPYAGWNLVGNPLSTAATITNDYYRMNDTHTGIMTEAGTGNIALMEGVFVQATEANQKVTFTAAQNGNNNGKSAVEINLSQNRGGVIDRAIVRFGNSNTLPKLQLFENSTKIYIAQDGEDFAIVGAEAQGEMPINFRANENGQYTLTVNPENVEMNYLHLIDNMTGMDINLLQTPSYTFNATTTDYESRFRLVFAGNNEDGASTGSASFAFFSNGSWIINNAGEATLQVIDLTGRILSSESVNGSVSTTLNATPGVYMLRLINGENVKVQKIVVR